MILTLTVVIFTTILVQLKIAVPLRLTEKLIILILLVIVFTKQLLEHLMPPQKSIAQ
jgi:hypothetical protein